MNDNIYLKFEKIVVSTLAKKHNRYQKFLIEEGMNGIYVVKKC